MYGQKRRCSTRNKMTRRNSESCHDTETMCLFEGIRYCSLFDPCIQVKEELDFWDKQSICPPQFYEMLYFLFLPECFVAIE